MGLKKRDKDIKQDNVLALPEQGHKKKEDMLSSRIVMRQCRGGMQSLMLRRSLASAPDSSSQPDLVVEYLEEENKGIVVLGMNRPKAMNALSKRLAADFTAAIEAA